MGIIKAISDAVRGGLADQWLEVIEPDDMGGDTVFTSGVQLRRGERNSNTKATSYTVSNGSVIHVYPNQFMMLVDGGKIVDYTAEEGYYTVNDSTIPSLFNGELGETVPGIVLSDQVWRDDSPGAEGVLYQPSGDQGDQIRHH